MDEEALERYLRNVNEVDPEAPGFDENPGFFVFDLYDSDDDDDLP